MTYTELSAYLDKSLEHDALWQRLVSRDNTQRQHMAQSRRNGRTVTEIET